MKIRLIIFTCFLAVHVLWADLLIDEDFLNADTTQFTMNGDAYIRQDWVRLTTGQRGEAGSIFFNTPHQLETFRAEFQIYCGNNGNGGDGACFVWQANSPNELRRKGPQSGGALGYETMENSYAVELDTYYNTVYNDPNGNHIGIDIDGDLHSIATATEIPQLENGDWINFIVTLDEEKLLTVIMEDQVVLTYQFSEYRSDMSYYFGFTAASGMEVNVHAINEFRLYGDYIYDIGFRPNRDGYKFENYSTIRTHEMFERYFGEASENDPDSSHFFNYLQKKTEGSCAGYSATSLIHYFNLDQQNAGPFAMPQANSLGLPNLYSIPSLWAIQQIYNSIAFYQGCVCSYDFAQIKSAPSVQSFIDSTKSIFMNGGSYVLGMTGFDGTDHNRGHQVVPYKLEMLADSSKLWIYNPSEPDKESCLILYPSINEWHYTALNSSVIFPDPKIHDSGLKIFPIEMFLVPGVASWQPDFFYDSGFRPQKDGYQFRNESTIRTREMFECYFGEASQNDPDSSHFHDFCQAGTFGSSAGYSATSLINYFNFDQLYAGSFAMPQVESQEFPNLFSIPSIQSSQKIYNSIAYYQGCICSHSFTQITDEPDVQTFIDSTTSILTSGNCFVLGIIGFQADNHNKGHLVVPYKIEIWADSTKLWIYDPNDPGKENYLVLKPAIDQWYYNPIDPSVGFPDPGRNESCLKIFPIEMFLVPGVASWQQSFVNYNVSVPSEFNFVSFPNPFNSHTTIEYELPESANVSIDIFDVLGRSVRSIHQGHQNSGKHTVVWDGKSSEGHELSSGMYVAKIQVKAGELNSEKMIKMFLVK